MASLPPPDLVERAQQAFVELLKLKTWAASLSDARIAAEPLMVAALAETQPAGRRQPLPDYGIVEARRGRGVTARFAVDAGTGLVLEVEGVRTPGAVLPPYVDARRIIELRFPGAVEIEAVWGPCRESTSRFLPFWRFRAGAGGKWQYLRADGHFYDTLTVLVRG